jgi:uncharacterized membrane protein YdbT with pleckstrin-like domain
MLEPGEHILTVVHRSIIALIGVYLEIIAGVAALVALILVLSPNTFRDISNGSSNSLLAIAVLFIALVIIILALVTYIYLQNKLLITDRSLIQITQRGPFAHKASRLSMSNVEDVSANQRGLLATIFGYGTLLVQTAGTLDNFEFTYCPNPNTHAHQILESREAYAAALREANEHP